MVQIKMTTHLLGANELLANKNRRLFEEKGMLVINLMSSPGAGKTTILERTIEMLSGKIRIGVIEGDLYTDQDAVRIGNKGIDVIQINTEGACHLDAGMVGKAFEQLPNSELDLLFIENVGNLVCPAEFDLGEDYRAVVLSTVEGNDKPMKYPLIFHQARAVLLNKTDLLPYTDFDLDRFREDLVRINPSAEVFEVSGRTGEGIEDWLQWLLEEVKKKQLLR
ncbi:MAG TPA: hydrogenase nickel incorporation protein HypB [Syntrophomonadaceae bacterium]|jgi:hydrogenase nickel incorporation protein HypB|nr:hydrogenase nickel incorporation protein HypB [Syntrophomonadaceae bacterium]HRX20919.1 hydrogenase nickel incorporation protein HypB [Syntrophomonadaceae bacterium]